ncbi:hypothetical protein BCR43DRAFT_481256 [Syncephalastrum racemosum]|uniref:Uncharacterized protein n=1 Tax=Syncephalastrum racemosum TaxID=13706 RepID=A0A1X2HRS3_SYNRA|nr:hypothetical protein BCR43DRAFT_481256 [Syncephalastrum racemosum]
MPVIPHESWRRESPTVMSHPWLVSTRLEGIVCVFTPPVPSDNVICTANPLVAYGMARVSVSSVWSVYSLHAYCTNRRTNLIKIKRIA